MPETKDQDPISEEAQMESIADYVKRLDAAGRQYRDQFVTTWQGIEAQVEQVEPPEWGNKEEWQTKAIIPLQTKKSEIAPAKLDEILFPGRGFFTIEGTEEEDRQRDDHLIALIRTHLDRAKFYLQKEWWLQEGADNGLSFLKFTSNPKGDGLVCTWVSSYSCSWDPTVRHDWSKSKFWVEHSKKDWGVLLEETKQGMYNDADGTDAALDRLNQVLDAGVAKAHEIMGMRSGRGGQKTVDEDRLATVRSVFGVGLVKVPADWVDIQIKEFWGMVKVPQVDNEGNPAGYRFESRKVVMANEFVLQDVPNPFAKQWTWYQGAGIPVFPVRVKPRKYEFVGRGYLQPGMNLQDLVNQLVCLGFDSLKINAMDIIILDNTKVKDQASIKYKPLAVWKLSDVNAVKLTRTGLSSLTDIMRGIAVLDAIDQDTTGVTKSVQGTPDIASEGKDSTLGEFQLKLQGVDRRFIKVARFIEEDALIPIVWFVYSYLKNSKVYTAGQKGIDRILGMRKPEAPDQPTQVGEEGGELAGIANLPVPEESKLVLADLPSPEIAAWDFKMLGVTNFLTKIQVAAALQRALDRAAGNELLLGLTKIDLLYRDLMDAEEIPDAGKYVRTKDEVATFLESIQQSQPGTLGGPAIAQPQARPRAGRNGNPQVQPVPRAG